MVKNEADIIEPFVRHNVEFLDGLVLLDNASIDGTRDILRRLELEGLPLVVLDDPEVAYTQSRKMSALLINVAAVFDPDWIVLLDADEAIDAAGREGLERALSIVPPGSLVRLGWRTYVPTPHDDPRESNPLRRLRHRRSVEDPQWFKVVVPRRLWLEAPLVLADGNHEARRPWCRASLPMKALTDVRLAHFPIRSAEQISRKIICGWLAVLANPARREQDFGHWREMYESTLSQGSISPDELVKLGMSYAVGRDGIEIEEESLRSCVSELRYSTSTPLPLVVAVARTAEQVARLSAQRERLSRGHALVRAAVPRPLWAAGRVWEYGAASAAALAVLAARLGLETVLVIGGPRALKWSPFSEGGVCMDRDAALKVSYASRLEDMSVTSPAHDAVVWWEAGGRTCDRARAASLVTRLARRTIVWIPATEVSGGTAEPATWPDPNSRWHIARVPTLAYRLASAAPVARQRSLVLVPQTAERSESDGGLGLGLLGSAGAERFWREWPRTWRQALRGPRMYRWSPRRGYRAVERLLSRVVDSGRRCLR